MSTTPATTETPTWFLMWLIEQVGGSAALDGKEILAIQERLENKTINFWNDDFGRFLIEIKDNEPPQLPLPVYKQGGIIR